MCAASKIPPAKYLTDNQLREVPSGCAPIYMTNLRGRQVYAVVDQAWFTRLAAFEWYVKKGYAVRYERKEGGGLKMIYMHREVLQVSNDVALPVDHINGDTLDNRTSNLRLVTISVNTQNRRHGTGTSRYLGVSYEPKTGKWRARIIVEGKTIQLGTHPNEVAAAHAYDDAAIKYFGPNARTNTYGENQMSGTEGEECPCCAKIVAKLVSESKRDDFKPCCKLCLTHQTTMRALKDKIAKNKKLIERQQQDLAACAEAWADVLLNGEKLRKERGNGS